MSVAGKLSRYPWRRALMALGLIAVAGAARMPIEHAAERELRELGFRDWSPDISAREQLTQASFVAALGGFRSLVATAYDLRAHIARTDKDWGKVEAYRNVSTSLQPRFWKHWDMAAWDMAWNAFAYYRGEAERNAGTIDGWQYEKVVMPRYLESGIDFAKRGMKWMPDNYRLPRIVADIYKQKYEDPCAAAEWYLKSSQAPDAPPYIFRAYAHNLALCEGREEEAYALVSELYRGGQRTPTVRHDMERLEEHFSRLAAESKTRAELEAALREDGASYRDLAALAMHLLEVEEDLPAAVSAYGGLARDEDAPTFYRRRWAFLVAADPGKAPVAYDALRRLYLADPNAFRPEDMAALYQLEERLSIPAEERVTGGE